jgi:hypothetical protein
VFDRLAAVAFHDLKSHRSTEYSPVPGSANIDEQCWLENRAMQVAVRIERLPEIGYRAHTGEPFGLMAEGATRDGVVAALRSRFISKIHSGEIVILDIPLNVLRLGRFVDELKHGPLDVERREAIGKDRKPDNVEQID